MSLKRLKEIEERYELFEPRDEAQEETKEDLLYLIDWLREFYPKEKDAG